MISISEMYKMLNLKNNSSTNGKNVDQTKSSNKLAKLKSKYADLKAKKISPDQYMNIRHKYINE